MAQKQHSKLLWKPSAKKIAQSQMMHFMHFVNAEHHLSFSTYSELYQWSLCNPEHFWSDILNFCGVITSKREDHVLINADKMPGAQWFVGAQLNFAENLLRHRSQKIALVFCNENGKRKTLTYEALYQEVATLAAALRKLGVKALDRVVGFLPNVPETVIAMLATTSIGGVWSSCSPDFGVEGAYDRFGQIEPKILLTTDGYFYHGKSIDSLEKIKQLEEKISSLKKIIVIPYLTEFPDLSGLKQKILYSTLMSPKKSTLSFEQLPFDHPIYILYSSGTTGFPKCIVHGAGNVLLQHLKELMLHTDLKEKDVFFYFTTCGWMMWNWLVSGLTTGATLLLYDGSPFYPTPLSLFNLIDNEKITVFGTSAKFISSAEKFKLDPIKTHRLNTLRLILSTGSPLLSNNFDYVYQHIKKEICLSSISGGTDIVSCFASANPILPVYEGELQCRDLGINVQIYDETGKSVSQKKGELVCTAPFPAMPIYFWNDPDGKKYRHAYFEKFPNVWSHGDYAELTEHEGLIIYGRSDTTLNPGGIRIGTAEIYKQVEKMEEIAESLVIGQSWENNERIILFVKLQAGKKLTPLLQDHIKALIRKNLSPHHVPAKIIQVADIPKTINGKIVELAVHNIVHGLPVINKNTLINPESLRYFKDIPELSSQ